jgi:hypothetical protein
MLMKLQSWFAESYRMRVGAASMLEVSHGFLFALRSFEDPSNIEVTNTVDSTGSLIMLTCHANVDYKPLQPNYKLAMLFSSQF